MLHIATPLMLKTLTVKLHPELYHTLLKFIKYLWLKCAQYALI